jgi:hypothetical protein
MVSYIAYLRKDKDSDFGVEFPDVPGCVSAGRTLEEARATGRDFLSRRPRRSLRVNARARVFVQNQENRPS